MCDITSHDQSLSMASLRAQRLLLDKMRKGMTGSLVNLLVQLFAVMICLCWMCWEAWSMMPLEKVGDSFDLWVLTDKKNVLLWYHKMIVHPTSPHHCHAREVCSLSSSLLLWGVGGGQTVGESQTSSINMKLLLLLLLQGTQFNRK